MVEQTGQNLKHQQFQTFNIFSFELSPTHLAFLHFNNAFLFICKYEQNLAQTDKHIRFLFVVLV